MFIKGRRGGVTVPMCGLALLALSACEPVAEQSPVNVAESRLPVPDLLSGQAAPELFTDGGTIFAILNVYDSTGNTLVQTSQPSEQIGSASTTSKVEWNNIQLSGDPSQYLFEVVWKSTRYASIDNKKYTADGGIDIAFSAKAPLSANNSLLVSNYDTADLNRLDANGDKTSNYNAIKKNEDPLGCYLDASNLDQCRLF